MSVCTPVIKPILSLKLGCWSVLPWLLTSLEDSVPDMRSPSNGRSQKPCVYSCRMLDFMYLYAFLFPRWLRICVYMYYWPVYIDPFCSVFSLIQYTTLFSTWAKFYSN